MREKMPATAAFIDQLRAAFGADAITLAMREGLRDGGFWAVECGHVVGDPPLAVRVAWAVAPAGTMGPFAQDDRTGPVAWLQR